MMQLKALATSLLGVSISHASSGNQPPKKTSRDNSQTCDCYLVSGDDSGYFQYYRFSDFRSIANDGSDDYTSAPPVVTMSENSGGQDVTSAFFNSTQFSNDWSIQNMIEPAQPGAAVPYINSAQNVFISQDPEMQSTYLTLRAFRLPDFTSAAEIDSNQKNVRHGSFRARMRVVPYFSNDSVPFVDTGVPTDVIDGLSESHPVAPGAVVGFFTYRSDSQESDLEILTYDPITTIRYSNQPDYDAKTGDTVPGASTDAVLPDNKVWTEWHNHRIDWFDGMCRWYIDGELVLEKTKNVPTKPSAVVLNLWSDGGEWSGNMTAGAQVVAGFQWIEMAFNVSGKNPSKRHAKKSCNLGCDVGDVQGIGHPPVAFNDTGRNSGTSGGSTVFAGGVVQMMAFFVAVLVFNGICAHV